jgi:hypothetical protein
MLYDNEDYKIRDLEEFFAGSLVVATSQKAVEALHTHLIVGFEEALGLGLAPMEALGQVLSWVACEMARVKIE